MLEMELRIRLETRDATLIAGLLALIAVGIFVILIDYNTVYTWIMPLNTPRGLSWYYKTSIGIGVVNQASNITSLTVLNGIITNIVLGEYNGGYAVIISKGLNAYVVVIVLVDLLICMVFSMKTRRLVTKGVIGILSLLLLVVLYVVPLLTLLPYIDYGRVYSNHRVIEPLQPPVLNIPMNILNYTEIPNAHPALRYAYRVTDEVRELSLIHVDFHFNDTLMPIMLVRVLIDNDIVRQEYAYNTAFYTSSGLVEIYVFSPLPLNNSVISYYKVEFEPLDQGMASLLFMIPMSLLIVVTVLSALQLQLIKIRVLKRNRT